MVKNTDILGSMLFCAECERQTDTHEKASVMGYRTLLEASGIHHSNSGLQITHDMYINGYYMLCFDLTPDGSASEGHTSHPDSCNIRVELKFSKPLPETITGIFYLEFDDSVRIDYAQTSNGHEADIVHPEKR